MHCPIDNNTLQMTTREGIEIDYCPECRGVWLDRGELDKLIERAGTHYSGTPATPSSNTRLPAQPTRYDDDDSDDYHEHDTRRQYSSDDYRHGQHKKKKEGFLGDLFDF